jgi:RNA polymerase sigma factor (sigma-70 family)
MARSPPKELVDLLGPPDAAATSGAWQRFLQRHSQTILNAAWCAAGDYDGQMDRYAYILEQLQRDGFKRLRGYTTDPRARFQTWLTVVCRRMCIDYHRQQYGRERAVGRESKESTERRRRLVDLVADELDPDETRDWFSSNPEEEARSAELSKVLETALAGLGADDRLLLKLRFEHDLSAKEVARVLRMPTVFHFYRRLEFALGFLKQRLEKHGIEGSEP